jgi:hypothetical protein
LKVFASTVIAAISSAAETLLSGLEEDIRCGGNEGPQWAVSTKRRPQAKRQP